MQSSLALTAATALSLGSAFFASPAMAAHPQARPARVTEQHRSGYVVADAPEAALRTESPPEWQRPPGFRRDRAAAHEAVVTQRRLPVVDAARGDTYMRATSGSMTCLHAGFLIFIFLPLAVVIDSIGLGGQYLPSAARVA